MKPPALIRGPMAFPSPVPVFVTSAKTRIGHPVPGPVKDTFQIRAQTVLDFLVGTLRKTW